VWEKGRFFVLYIEMNFRIFDFSQTNVAAVFSIKRRNDTGAEEAVTMANGQYPAQKAIIKRKMANFSSLFFKRSFQKSDFFKFNDTDGSSVVRRGD